MNTTTKHTPGPWFVDTDPDGAEDCQSVWYSNGHGVSAEIAGRICEPANAALIAAAPDMLEALKRANYWIAKQYGTILPVDEQTVYEFARNAIDKAEGRS